MAKKEKKPEYVASPINTPMLNYRVYYMSKQEKLITFLAAFLVGGAIGLIFYGGQFLDALGAPTKATLICNYVIFLLAGLIAVKVFFPMRTEQLKAARNKALSSQFRSFLDSLSVAMSSGMNTYDSMKSALEDLTLEYGKNAYIVNEVSNMIACSKHNFALDETMKEFGERSEIEDIVNFSIVFSISYRAGGDTKDIVRRSNQIISDKLEISEHIKTVITSNKSQFNIMLFIPVVIVLMLRNMSSDFAKGFSTLTGVAAITIACGMFVAAYFLAQKIMDVEG